MTTQPYRAGANRPPLEPLRRTPATLAIIEKYREDPLLVEGTLKANEPANLAIEARVSGLVEELPGNLEALTHAVAMFKTVYAPQAAAAVAVAKDDLENVSQMEIDTKAVAKAAKAGEALITAVKLPEDKRAKAVAYLSQMERIHTAVRREERNALERFHAELQKPATLKAWAEVYEGLYLEESDLLDVTLRQANVIRLAAMQGRPHIEALYMLGVGQVTPRERKRLKAMFAASPKAMPTIQDVRAEATREAENAPMAVNEREVAERKARAKTLNEATAAANAISRNRRSDSTVTK